MNHTFGARDTEIVAAHLRHLRLLGQSEGSIYARARALHRMARAIPGDLADAGAKDLGRWRESLEVSPEAIVHYVSHAKEFYRWCVAEGIREDNPAQDLPVPRTPQRLPRPIAEEALMCALETAEPRVRPWLVLAAWCGLRAKEIALLRWENVLDTAAPPVLLVASDATKGRKERAIPLHPFAAAELAALPGRRVGFVFRRHDGRPGANAPWLVSQLSNEHLHACGSPATLHQLRHRFGTQTYRASHDLRAVQDLLGHSSPSTTSGYAAYDRTEAVAAVLALPVPVSTKSASVTQLRRNRA